MKEHRLKERKNPSQTISDEVIHGNEEIQLAEVGTNHFDEEKQEEISESIIREIDDTRAAESVISSLSIRNLINDDGLFDLSAPIAISNDRSVLASERSSIDDDYSSEMDHDLSVDEDYSLNEDRSVGNITGVSLASYPNDNNEIGFGIEDDTI